MPWNLETTAHCHTGREGNYANRGWRGRYVVDREGIVMVGAAGIEPATPTMGSRFDKQCRRCGAWEVEQIEDWTSDQCPRCNDRDIERKNERDEWNYYHPPLPVTGE